jgi:biuret amidohydrolase
VQEVNGVQVPRTLEDLCRPERMALIVYDMQIGILHQLKDGAEIVGRVLCVVQAARQAGLRII